MCLLCYCHAYGVPDNMLQADSMHQQLELVSVNVNWRSGMRVCLCVCMLCSEYLQADAKQKAPNFPKLSNALCKKVTTVCEGEAGLCALFALHTASFTASFFSFLHTSTTKTGNQRVWSQCILQSQCIHLLLQSFYTPTTLFPCLFFNETMLFFFFACTFGFHW